MRAPVKYSNPPVVEVVCGVMFAQGAIQAAHIGSYWNSIREDFPKVEEAAPLSPILEDQATTGLVFEWSTLPPPRRVWLFNADGSHLIQIQSDRFLFNWKHTLGASGYPSYQVVVAEFEKHLHSFVAFMRDKCGVDLSYRQFEMTYVNHIMKDNGLPSTRELSVLVDHVCRESSERFLPEAENFNLSKSFLLPEGAGRLHIVAQTTGSNASNDRLLRLDLVARGIPADVGEGEIADKARKQWFDLAHEWITQGFADITCLDVQKNIWKRTS